MPRIRTGSKRRSLRVWTIISAAAGLAGALCIGGSAATTVEIPMTSPFAGGFAPEPTGGAPVVGASGLLDDGSCVKCHRFEPVLTHPVGVRPSMATPASLPLPGGLVRCTTCHEAGVKHAETREKVGVRGGAGGETMCLQCHEGASMRTKASHTVGTWTAHLKVDRRGNPGVSGVLDVESRGCMGCHDGATASDAGSHAMRGSGMEATADHPIGVPMRATRRRGESDFGLANPATLDKRIRLPGGNLACGSCHSVYSREPAQLVMSNRGSKLCLSCHTQ